MARRMDGNLYPASSLEDEPLNPAEWESVVFENRKHTATKPRGSVDGNPGMETGTTQERDPQRVGTLFSEEDKKRAPSDFIFNTWMPIRLLTFEFLFMVIVIVAIGFAETRAARPWVVPLVSLNRNTAFVRVVDRVLGESGSAWVLRGTDTRARNELRAFEIKQGVEAPCPNVGGSCNAHIQQNVQKVAADILNEFTTGLRAQGGAATPEQKRALRDRLISDAGPIRPHEMRKVTHVDLLVVLAVWCGISICARGVCNYVHMQAPQAEQLRLKSKRVWYAKIEDLRVADRMATIMLPFSFIVPLLPIVYGIVRMGYDGAGMELYAVLMGFLALAVCGWVAWRKPVEYDVSVYSVPAISYSSALDSDPSVDYGFNGSWVTLCVVKPLLASPLFIMISFALSGMIQFESMLYTVLLSLGAAVLSAVMSYYNLYATHRKWLQGEVAGTAQDRRVEDKAKRPMQVITLQLLCVAVVTFLPWPRRFDLDIIWPVEFCILFMFFGFMTMILPDVMYHRRYMNALITRERAELFLRAVLVVTVCTLVFREQNK